jgi:hypothetical protein
MIEAVVSAGLLLGVMSFAVQMTYRVDGVWRDTAQHRVAIHELSNHLDRLTLLSPEEIVSAIDAIVVSDAASRTLHDAKLDAERIDDELGTRIVVRINWTRRTPGNPVVLVGWLRDSIEDRDVGLSDRGDAGATP